ncbi:MAG: DUF3127 domain-containing protein [Bacteroidales bacterium]
MEIIGKLVEVLPDQRGESARGPWIRGGFVIETDEQYSRKVAFSLWGEDKLMAMKNIALGTTLKIVFSLESREFQGRWYTDCRCNNIETFTSAMPQNPYVQQMQAYQPPMSQSQMQPQSQVPSSPTTQDVQQESSVAYQQPPVSSQQMGGTIEQAEMEQDGDDLPF